MKKISAIVVLATLLLTACSKDKKAIQDMEGSWLEIKIDDTTIPDAQADKITFGPCKNKKKETCDCTITDSGGSLSYTFDYEVDDDGESLVIIQTVGGFQATSKYKILSLDGTTMKIQWANYTGEYKKI